MVIIRTMAAVDECRRSLPGMGHDFFDDVAPSTIFLAPVAMWRSDWEWAQRGASASVDDARRRHVLDFFGRGGDRGAREKRCEGDHACDGACVSHGVTIVAAIWFLLKL